MQKEINTLKTNDTVEAITPKVLGIEMSKENSQQLGADVRKFVEMNIWDERAIMDERYKRDNEIAIDSDIEGDVVILRDAEGRLA